MSSPGEFLPLGFQPGYRIGVLALPGVHPENGWTPSKSSGGVALSNCVLFPPVPGPIQSNPIVIGEASVPKVDTPPKAMYQNAFLIASESIDVPFVPNAAQ
jgi:hypothetical protein